jgi:hypothetical protein
VNGETERFTEMRGFAHIANWSQLEEVVKSWVQVTENLKFTAHKNDI